MHPEDCDAVVAPVRDQDKHTGGVHGDPAAGIHVARVALWDGSHCLHQPKCGSILALDDALCARAVELEDGDLRRELVDDIAKGMDWVELDVPRAQSLASWGAGRHGARRSQNALDLVEVELPDEVHAQIRHVGDLPEGRVQNDGVRVRVALPLLLGARIVLRVVDVLVGSGLHGTAPVGVVHRAKACDRSGVWVQAEDADSRVPVIDHEHVLAPLVQRDVARGGAAR
mmetsp:Transcript_19527/g.54576  ORF Transcript_19527/g.54576 Transcript_19527/m.54576 type:complete len:228 (+) Transcript_19527:374-1057(+)